MLSIRSKRRTMRAGATSGHLLVLALFAVLLAVPATASAQTATAWDCEASALRLELGGETIAEPVTANDGAAECRDQHAATPAIDQGTGNVLDPSLPVVKATVDGAYAITDLAREGGATFAQEATARAGAASARVEIANADGEGLVIEVEGLTSRASGECTNGQPTLTSDFDAATIRINGEEASLDDALAQIAAGLSEAGFDPLVKVEIGKQIATGDATTAEQSLTIRAIEVQLLGAPEPVARLVIGESTVGRSGPVCTPPPCPAGTIPNAQGQCVLIIFPPCPEGSTENELGQCVVPEGPDGECPPGSLRSPEGVCVLIVTPPCPTGSVDNGQNQCILPPSAGIPTGGTIVPAEEVPANLARRCRVGAFGSQLAIMGTPRNDRITGTNRSDRIFSLGGSDRISGGRGNDCLEGGSGNDNLDGSNGRDLMLGGAGRDIHNGGTGGDTLRGEASHDKLTGGSGSDRIEGGSGRDRLSGGFGRDTMYGGSDRDYLDGGNGGDRMYGGSGNDAINGATAGRDRDIIDCGRGRDVARINGRDRTRNCERVMVVRRRR